MMPMLTAASLPIAEISIDGKLATGPDITQLSLDSFGTLPNSDLGVADSISLLDLSRIIDLRDMTLGLTIDHWSSQQKAVLTLDQYPFLAQLTLSEIARLTNSYQREIGDLPLAETALETFLQHPVLAGEKKLTLAQVLDRYPGVGDFKLGFLDLSEYNYKVIPNLLTVPITAIPGWEDIKPAEIVGLREIAIHHDIRIDGEILSLKTVPEDGRVSIKLQDDMGFSLNWSEDTEKGLRPFGSYSITPTLAGEKIAVNAFFSSCAEGALRCEQVGPFDYFEYDKGDAVYVSSKDWESAKSTAKNTIQFSRDPVETPSVDPVAQNIFAIPQVWAAVSLMGTGLVLGVFTIHRLVLNLGRENS